jgi:hypothetical protein
MGPPSGCAGGSSLASGQREDPMLLLPDQAVSTPRAGVAQWLGLLADGLARTPNGNSKVPLLFARAAHWLNDQDLAVRATLVEALDRNGQREEAMALLGPRARRAATGACDAPRRIDGRCRRPAGRRKAGRGRCG